MAGEDERLLPINAPTGMAGCLPELAPPKPLPACDDGLLLTPNGANGGGSAFLCCLSPKGKPEIVSFLKPYFVNSTREAQTELDLHSSVGFIRNLGDRLFLALKLAFKQLLSA